MATSSAFSRSEVEAMVSKLSTIWNGQEPSDSDLEAEVQTDKDRVKLVSCRECGRPLVVSTFYVPANARCASCKGESGANGAQKATVAVPRPGQTDPALAVNLADCLINKHFAFARCPVHPDDLEHAMELKSVDHSEYYGPSELMGYRNGRPEYRQIAQGETVLHQCTRCKATTTYSTTAQMQFARQNDATANRKHVNQLINWLGVNEAREEGIA